MASRWRRDRLQLGSRGTGTISAERLSRKSHGVFGSATKWADAWAPDTSVLASTEVSPDTKGDIWVVTPDGAERIPVVNSPFDERLADFSPDSSYIVFNSDESGQVEVYAQPYPGPGRKVLVSTVVVARRAGLLRAMRFSISAVTKCSRSTPSSRQS